MTSRIRVPRPLRAYALASALTATAAWAAPVAAQVPAQDRAIPAPLPPVRNAWYQAGSPSGLLVSAFPARVDSVNGARIRLDNGGLVELSTGAFGNVAPGKFTTLLLRDQTCRLWIEGRRPARCDMLEAPTLPGVQGIETSLLEVSENGKALRLLDGSVYRPWRLDWIDSSVWMSQARVVVVGDTLLNLDRASAGLLRVQRSH